MLGIVLALVIVLILLLLIGFSWSAILTYTGIAAAALLGLALIVIAVFFIGVICSLFGFRKEIGSFLRFEHSEHFDRAVYQCKGKEYTCLFPAENYGREKIYTSGEKKILIRDGKKRNVAYDRHSLLIIAVGGGFSILSIAGLLILFILQH